VELPLKIFFITPPTSIYLRYYSKIDY